jgi:hypothetical protein
VPVGWQATIAGVLAGIAGLSEIVARYRSDPKRAVLTVAGFLYILLNAVTGFVALYLVRAFGWTFGHTSNITLWRILISGFGALALFRSSLFITKIGNTTVGIGPSAVLESLTGALDRDVDRKSARAISAEHKSSQLAGLDPAAVMSTLPVLCLALMQNFPPGDAALLGSELTKVEKGQNLSSAAKMQATVIHLAKFLGGDLVTRVLQDGRSLFAIPTPAEASAVVDETKKIPSTATSTQTAGDGA